MNLFEYIKDIDSKSLFSYIVILVSILFFFQEKTVSNGVVIGLILGIAVVVYLNGKRTIQDNNEIEQHEHKSKKIRPFKEEFTNYIDVTDFIYSINEFYYYNPEAFEEFVNNFTDFLTVYENCKRAPNESHQLIDLADAKKHNILNSLHSIIYNLPSVDVMNFKLEDSLLIAEQIINKYLEEIYQITQEDLHNRGYNNNYKVYNLGPKPGNFYNKEQFTYDIF